jgi:hypothetical protein
MLGLNKMLLVPLPEFGVGARGGVSLKGDFEIMTATKNNSFSTHVQQIFAAFCFFVTDSCILLFFSNLASKSRLLLITAKAKFLKNPNQSQREFDSNVAIATFDHEPPAPKNKLFQTCFTSWPLCLEACCHFAPPTVVNCFFVCLLLKC